MRPATWHEPGDGPWKRTWKRGDGGDPRTWRASARATSPPCPRCNTTSRRWRATSSELHSATLIAMVLNPTTLLVLQAGYDTERLVTHLQHELAEEAQVLAPELPPVVDTPIAIKFGDGRRQTDAALRIREVLDAARPDWPDLLAFVEPSPEQRKN
jgi:hypothetical protein